MRQLPFGRNRCDQEDASACAWVYVGRRANQRSELVLAFLFRHPRAAARSDGTGLVQFELPSGQLFEVFGSESRYYQFHNCPVVGFQVEDVRAAKQEMESKGVEFMTDVLGDDKEAWAYFRGPDGYLYEIWQT